MRPLMSSTGTPICPDFLGNVVLGEFDTVLSEEILRHSAVAARGGSVDRNRHLCPPNYIEKVLYISMCVNSF